MKHLKHFLLAVLMALASILPASAYSFIEGGIAYEFYWDGSYEIPKVAVSRGGGENFYKGNITIPAAVTHDGKEYPVVAIGYSAFYDCLSLTSVDMPSVTAIGDWAFSGCYSLDGIDLSQVETIGEGAFNGCYSLSSIDLSSANKIGYSAFSYCTSLVCVKNFKLDMIVENLFSGCSSLTSFDLTGVKTIGVGAFNDCSSLVNVDLSAITAIEDFAFNNCNLLTECYIDKETPPACGAGAFSPCTMIIVPEVLYESYMSAPGFQDIPLQIAIKEYSSQEIEVEAEETTSNLLKKIGGEDMAKHIVNLKLNGTINSYDMMIMRNKMTGLRNLDLADVSIVYNPYQYYTGYCSQDNVVGDYWMYQREYPLVRITMPRTATRIGSSAFYGCYNLEYVDLNENLQSIEAAAFRNCYSLKKIRIPDGVEKIGSSTFQGCSSLVNLMLSKNLKRIESSAFYNCSSLKQIELPSYIEYIGSSAFYNCSSLEEVVIPAALQQIGDKAFVGCHNLNTVVGTTVEPVNINQNTFSTYSTATLYVPPTSYATYYFNTEWSQFLNVKQYAQRPGVGQTEGDDVFKYDYFYIKGDFTIDKETGVLAGDGPDGDLYETSGFINNDAGVQNLGEVHLRHDGYSSGASLVCKGQGKVHFDKLLVDINVNSGRWYFFSFPCDVEVDKIQYAASRVWHEYDGEARAAGRSGWKKVEDKTLQAGRGYIFQGAQSGTMTIVIDDLTIDASDLYTALSAHEAASKNDESWNLVGNRCPAFYDINHTGFAAPFTIYNDNGRYEAVRPGDDDYAFYPFQGFFVQKSYDNASLTFLSDKMMTRNQALNRGAQGARVAGAAAIDDMQEQRQLINLTLTSGETIDKARVVINPMGSTGYEPQCDAAKFLDNTAAQLYTVDVQGVQYAINERPEGDGIISLVVSAIEEGEVTIAATRADCPVILRDLQGHTSTDLAQESCTVYLKKGLHGNRFQLLVGAQATAINSVLAGRVLAGDGEIVLDGIDGMVEVYNLAGALVASHKGAGRLRLASGTYIVKCGGESIKVCVK